MLQHEIKNFASPDGRLNGDDADVAVGPNEWCDLRNCRTGTTDDGVTAVVESVWGNSLKSTPEPSVTHMTLGSAVDLENNRILTFKKDLYGTQDKIVCYYVSDGSEYTVLLSSQVEGGLGFHKWYPIHSARVLHGLLLWVNDTNAEPKCINIDAGIKLNHPSFVTERDAYVSPIPYETVTLIRRPPIYRLNVEKMADVGFENNFIQGNAYQFSYRYNYKDYQVSVLSTYSQLVPYNAPQDDDDGLNAVTVALPFAETVPDDVQAVEICVRYGNAGKSFVVKSWNKRNSDDLAAIAAHNSNTTALSFTFYDNERGEAIDSVTAATPFDNIALYAAAMEIAEGRVFMGRVTKGYDSPLKTSLSLSLGTYDTDGAGTYPAEWKYIEMPYVDDLSGIVSNELFYYAYASGLTNKALYFAARKGDVVPPPSIAADTATIQSTSENQMAASLAVITSPPSGTHWVYGAWAFHTTGQPLDIVFTVDLNGLQFFKSGSLYKVSVSFYDRFRRKCGVVEKKVSTTVPQRTYDQTVFASNIGWALSNTDALTEIPDWAWYYQIHISRNQTYLSFVQIYAGGTYVQKNADGTLDYAHTTFNDQSTYGVAFDLSQLYPNSLGYQYADGDDLIVYKTDGSYVKLNVLTQEGVYVIASPVDLGTLSPTNLLIELSTPYTAAATEPLYETGDMLPVQSPGTALRQYSVTSGTINGDCYAIQRTTTSSAIYIVEAMSPRDKVWSQWQTDRGWATYVDTIGQVQKATTVEWTDTYVNGTRINGWNKIGFTSTKALPSECGSIYKLQLTSKVEGEKGGILLCLFQKQVASLYLGEVQLYGSGGPATLAQTADVIGTVNVLKGEFGTEDPTTVTEYRGNVYWYDRNAERWVQYAGNGLFSFSSYKLTRFWKRFSQQYKSMSLAAIEALGSRPFLFAAVDPGHDELLITVPKLLAQPPRGYLPDYPSEPYAWDVWDGQAVTLVYKLDQGLGNPHWQGRYDLPAEGFASLKNRLYAYRYGHLYGMNEVGSTAFFGQTFSASIAFYGNLFGGLPKVAANISLEASAAPTFAYVRSEVPYVQGTDLIDDEWRELEGVFYATVKRNKLQPTAYGQTVDGKLIGEKMRAIAFRYLLRWTLNGNRVQLRRVVVGHEISRGHKNLLPP